MRSNITSIDFQEAEDDFLFDFFEVILLYAG